MSSLEQAGTAAPPLNSPFSAVEVGTGTWQWGDRLMWGFKSTGYGDEDVRQAFTASLDAGITFYDTAELYGFGTSERLLGRFIRESGAQVQVATKFFPYPWRLFKGHLISALRGSLRRLNMTSVDLYQIHFPTPIVSVETWASALADTLDMGLTKSVGVSNYDGAQTIRSQAVLAQRGYTLATNQVEYSLLDRHIERDGTMEAARTHGIQIIAYSPLAKGLLTGKYSVENPPSGARRAISRETLERLPKLIAGMRTIGDAHGGKSPAQVAINWAICKGTLPIPGAKNAQQAQHNAGGTGWRLTADEVAELERLAA